MKNIKLSQVEDKAIELIYIRVKIIDEDLLVLGCSSIDPSLNNRILNFISFIKDLHFMGLLGDEMKEFFVHLYDNYIKQ